MTYIYTCIHAYTVYRSDIGRVRTFSEDSISVCESYSFPKIEKYYLNVLSFWKFLLSFQKLLCCTLTRTIGSSWCTFIGAVFKFSRRSALRSLNTRSACHWHRLYHIYIRTGKGDHSPWYLCYCFFSNFIMLQAVSSSERFVTNLRKWTEPKPVKQLITLLQKLDRHVELCLIRKKSPYKGV